MSALATETNLASRATAARVYLLPLIAGVLFVAVTSYAQEKFGYEPIGEFEVLNRSELFKKAELAFNNKEFESAAALFQQVVADPNDSNDLRYPARIRLAMSLSNLGRNEQAEGEIRKGIQDAESLDNLGYGIITEGHRLLGRILSRQGKYGDAEATYRSRINTMEKRDMDAWSVRDDLIRLLRMQNKHAEVVAELRLKMKNLRPIYDGDSRLWKARMDLAEALILAGHSLEGIKEAREVIYGFQHLAGQHEEEILKTRLIIARAYFRLGKQSEAEGQFRIILETRTRSLGDRHPDTIRALFEIANCLKAQQKIHGALNTAKRALALSHQVLGPEHPDTKEYEKFVSELMR